MLRIAILRHEDGARRRLRIVERISLHPGSERPPVLVAKTPLEELRRFGFAIELRSEPTVERVAVIDPLLPCKRRKSFSSDSKPVRLRIFLRAFAGPRCRLISAPRGRRSEERRVGKECRSR